MVIGEEQIVKQTHPHLHATLGVYGLTVSKLIEYNEHIYIYIQEQLQKNLQINYNNVDQIIICKNLDQEGEKERKKYVKEERVVKGYEEMESSCILVTMVLPLHIYKASGWVCSKSKTSNIKRLTSRFP